MQPKICAYYYKGDFYCVGCLPHVVDDTVQNVYAGLNPNLKASCARCRKRIDTDAATEEEKADGAKAEKRVDNAASD